MQRQKLASKIVSIMLSVAMLVSTPMSTLATDSTVSSAPEQVEMQLASDTAQNTGSSEIVTDGSGEITENGETATEEAAATGTATTEEARSDNEDVIVDGDILSQDTIAAENEEIILDDITALEQDTVDESAPMAAMEGASNAEGNGQDENGEVSETPVITTDLSEETVTYGQGETAKALSVMASVTGSGTLTYQWYQVATKEGAEDIALNTSEEMPNQYVPTTETIGKTSYYVEVTNVEEGKSSTTVKSKVSTVEVLAKSATPTFTTNLNNTTEIVYPNGSQSKVLKVKVSVTDGGQLTYQWYRNTTASEEGAEKIEEDSVSKSYQPSTAIHGTFYYFVKVTNTKTDCAPTSVISNFAKVTIGSANPKFTTDLSKNEVNYVVGETADALQVEVTSPDEGTLTYQWHKNTTNSTTNGTLLNGEITNTYTPSTEENGTVYYYVIVTNTKDPYLPSSVTSQVAMITSASAKPVLTKDLDTAQVAYKIGSTAQPLTVEVATPRDGGTLSYQWYSNTSNSTIGGKAIENATSASYTPQTETGSTTYYYVVVTNQKEGYGPISTTSKVAPIVVLTKPVKTKDASSFTDKTQKIPVANTAQWYANSLDNQSAGGFGTLTYQWYKATEPDSYENAELITGGTNSVYTEMPSAIVGTTYYFVKITNTVGDLSEVGYSDIVSLTIEEPTEWVYGLKEIQGEKAIGTLQVKAQDTIAKRDDLVDGMGNPIVDPGPVGTILNYGNMYIYPSDTMMTIIARACLIKGVDIKGAEKGYISKLGNRSEFDRGNKSGWMGSLNGWYTNTGFQNYSVANGDVAPGDQIILNYTVDLGVDLGVSHDYSDKRLESLKVAIAQDSTWWKYPNLLSPGFDPDIHEYYAATGGNNSIIFLSLQAKNANNKVHVRIGDTQYRLSSGYYKLPIPEKGTTKKVEVIIEDPNGSSQETYTIWMSQEPSLLKAGSVEMQTYSENGDLLETVTPAFKSATYTADLSDYTQNASYNSKDLKINLKDLPEGATATLRWNGTSYDFTDGSVTLQDVLKYTVHNTQTEATLCVEAGGVKEICKIAVDKMGGVITNIKSLSGTPAFSETIKGHTEGTLFRLNDAGEETGETGYVTGYEQRNFAYNVYVSSKITTVSLNAILGTRGGTTTQWKIYANESLISEGTDNIDVKDLALDPDSTTTDLKILLTNQADDTKVVTYHLYFIRKDITPAEVEEMIHQLPALEEMTYVEHYDTVAAIKIAYDRLTEEQQKEISADAIAKLTATVAKLEAEYAAGMKQIEDLTMLINSYASQVTEENFETYQEAVLKSKELYEQLAGWIYDKFMSDHRTEYSYMTSAFEIVNKARIAAGSTNGIATDYIDDFMVSANAFNLTLEADEKAYPVSFKDYIASQSGEACNPWQLPGRLKFTIEDPEIFKIISETGEYVDQGFGGGATYENELYYMVPLREGTTTLTVTLADSVGTYYGQLPKMIVHVNSAKEAEIKDLPNKLTNINALPYTTKYDTWYYWQGSDGAPFTFSVNGTDAKVYVYDVLGNGNKTEYPVAEDGSVTILLKDGYNPIEVTATYEGQQVTQVYGLKGKVISYQVNNTSRPGQEIRQGDKVTINITGITTPVKKILRIYNPSLVRYMFETDMPYQSQVISDGLQYEAGSISFVATGSGTITLSNGHMFERWWGSALYSETTQGNTGEIAPQTTNYFSPLPDLTLEVKEDTNYQPDIKVTPTLNSSNTVTPGQTVTLSMSDLDLNWITDTYPQDVTNTYKCLLTAQSIFATDIPGLSNIASDKYDMDATGADARALSTIQTIKFTVPENTPDGTYTIRGGYVSVMYGNVSYGTYPDYMLSTHINDVKITVQHTCKWDQGTVTKKATCVATGTRLYKCTVEGCNKTKTETIPATGHKFGTWKTESNATVFAPKLLSHTCTKCGYKDTEYTGSALKPTIKVNAETVLLKMQQKTSAFKVKGLANGDSITSYKSCNTKIFTVDKKGVITAGKKTGSAKLTITLKSGLKKQVTVKVQKNAVTTTKITGLTSKVTVKKGAKLTLKPSRLPITSTQKFTYATSNKKVATVSSAGVIKAKAAGTAKITVKSGSKKVVVTVTVPKTKTTAITVKTSVTVKKGKTIALNAKKTPANSDQKITYASANKKIATVTSAGKIKGVKKGTTTITVKSGNITKKIKVTVK